MKPQPNRRQYDCGRESSDRLLETAESLFGRFGIDGVSMRQIRLEAGCNNNSAVQYHFGHVPGLAKAILDRRAPDIQLRRSKLLSAIDADGSGFEPEALLSALFRPILEYRNSRGQLAYARFIVAFLQSTQARIGDNSRFLVTEPARVMISRLRSLRRDMPRDLFNARIHYLTIMICGSVDAHMEESQNVAAAGFSVEDVLNIATSAFMSPQPRG